MNELFIAAAGSGKTSLIIDKALNSDEQSIILTYTVHNCDSIKERIVDKAGVIPENVHVQTWFSFLLEHGIRPYRSLIVDKKINGINQGEHDLKEKKTDISYYLDSEGNVYKDHLSELAMIVDDKSSGMTVERIARIFHTIMIDEAQDLSGYDYDYVEILSKKCQLVIVCDYRQRTFRTNNNKKNTGKYNTIVDFIQKKKLDFVIDKESLSTNHRSVEEICTFSNKLFPEILVKSDFKFENPYIGVYVMS